MNRQNRLDRLTGPPPQRPSRCPLLSRRAASSRASASGLMQGLLVDVDEFRRRTCLADRLHGGNEGVCHSDNSVTRARFPPPSTRSEPHRCRWQHRRTTCRTVGGELTLKCIHLGSADESRRPHRISKGCDELFFELTVRRNQIKKGNRRGRHGVLRNIRPESRPDRTRGARARSGRGAVPSSAIEIRKRGTTAVCGPSQIRISRPLSLRELSIASSRRTIRSPAIPSFLGISSWRIQLTK